jgi:hypothetical protein
MARKTTTAMEAHAQVLLARSHKWAEGTEVETGRAFYLFASSRTDPEGRPMYHRTARDGSACTCPSYYHRGACSHAEACRLAAERAREAVGPKRASYSELFSDEALGLTSAF